jgi:hypothetical protein
MGILFNEEDRMEEGRIEKEDRKHEGFEEDWRE